MRPEDSARRKKQSGQHQDGGRKPPYEVQDKKLPSRQAGIARPAKQSGKKSRKTLFRPDVPGSDDHNEKEQISPMQEEAKTQASFPKENREENANAREIAETFHAFAQAREAGAEPKPGEPRATELAPLITANRTKYCTGDEGAKNRFWCDGSAEQELATGTELDQAR